MKSFIILLLISLVYSTSLNNPEDILRSKFIIFQRRYGKSYSTQHEFDHRFQIFKENLIKAEEHQRLNPLATFGITKFSDLTSDEFKSKYLTFDRESYRLFNSNNGMTIKQEINKPEPPPPQPQCTPNGLNYDWSSCGVITVVKDSGQCGCCWAECAAEMVESYYALLGYPLTPLSVSQIIDCDTQGEDEGCNGGFPTGAYQYIQKAGGLESEASYPYSSEAGESGNCNYNPKLLVADISEVFTLSTEEELYVQLSTPSQQGGGPVGACVDSSSWQTYTGGVLTSCGQDVDNCVQVTGYANYGKTGAYWIVRNIWGSDWGENGYIWLSIGNNTCGIDEYLQYVSVFSLNGTIPAY